MFKGASLLSWTSENRNQHDYYNRGDVALLTLLHVKVIIIGWYGGRK